MFGAFMNVNGRQGVRVHDRHVLMAFIAALAVAIYSSPPPFGKSLGDSFYAGFVRDSVFFQYLLSAGAGEMIVIAALFAVTLQLGDDELLSRGDLLAIALASLAFLLPSTKAIAIPMIVAGLIFLPRRDARLSSIGQLLLAFAFYKGLGRILFNFVSPIVLPVETAAVQMLLSPFGQFTWDNLTISAANGHRIYVEAGCSAFHNVSLATLLWISLLKLETLELKRFHWGILTAMASATIALNTTRIAMMAQSRSMLEYWHADGPGATIISFVMLAAMLGIFLGGRSFAAPR